MPPNSDVICGKKDATLPSPGESQQNPPNSHVFPENLASFPRKCGVIPFYLILSTPTRSTIPGAPRRGKTVMTAAPSCPGCRDRD